MNNKEIPRPEYPRPDLRREKWKNLNGSWEFEIDQGKSGRSRGLPGAEALADEIKVPFCPESELSGINNKDFMDAVWYKRKIEIPEEWADGRIVLHFGAVDYETEVWVNGTSVGTHQGGYTPFSFDITDYLQDDENTITVCAEDDTRSGRQPSGKQSPKYHSHRCYYTRTTGIWQTVWLEPVPENYIKNYRVIPDAAKGSIQLEVTCKTEIANKTDYQLAVKALYEGDVTAHKTVSMKKSTVNLALDLNEVYLWGPGEPNLYDLEIKLLRETEPEDEVEGYFGLRDIELTANEILINDEPVFQRLVLDQGFYPEGIYTAPSDEELKKDIERSLAMGFNGARLHEKIFEPRFLYWADKLGYMVWGEHGNWGLDITSAEGLKNFLPEWTEAVERDFNHPSIVGWCPFNETWDYAGCQQDDEVLRIVYRTTKKIDRTRPVIDTSGNYHVETDIFDIHDYEQDSEKFMSKFEPMKSGEPEDYYVTHDNRQDYGGEPYFVSEYGGIWWNPENKDGWGYGNRPESEQEFLERYRKLTETLLENPYICAFCYTQLYDIEQETNGLYTYDREAKFSPEVIKEINSQSAEIER